MKKLLSMLVALVMGLSIIPMSVFANGTLSEEIATYDVYEIISSGIGSSEAYIREQLETAHNGDGVCFGYEWYIISMLRAGKTVDEGILDEYYSSVTETVKTWSSEVKPTDAERTALALTVMGKDITGVDGVNLAELIYNNEKLTNGSNELAYALIALDAAKVEIPDDAVWSRESIIDSILSFQTTDGAFGLSDNETPDIDMTAISLQALAPYIKDEKIKTATDNALEYLKSVDYSGNVNSAAQILMAASILKLDVTNEENGFGNIENNLITVIETYRNPDGNGYVFEERVSSLATFQVMQAYDAYKKSFKEDISYWDFKAKGEENEDDKEDDKEEPTLPDVESAEPATVYATIVSDGNIVKDKNDTYVAQAPVIVTDLDRNGVLTVDEALYAAHETYYEGGAETGYNSFTGTYGLSLGVLWGKGTPGTSATASYWLNNKSCWSLADEVKEGDYITAFNYYDTVYWSDSYSFFGENVAEAKSGSSVKLTLYAMGYDENWNSVSSFYKGAKVRFLENEKSDSDAVTDENGQIKISMDDVEPGTYYIVAYSDTNAIVPAVCKIKVTKKSSSGSSSGGGGGGSNVDKEEVKDDEKKEENDIVIEEKTEIENVKNVFTEDTFTDVKTDSWYYNSVKYVYENNLMSGTEKGFEPESEMTRAMLVTVLYRMANPEENAYSHNFADVTSNQWYSEAVAWAASKGIVNGVNEKEFAPDRNITREQMAVIIYRFAKIQGYDVEGKADITRFSDSEKISDWALDALGWANNSGVINGLSENILSPESTSTRAQVATILMRFCEINN